jgi:hypothetical protein
MAANLAPSCLEDGTACIAVGSTSYTQNVAADLQGQASTANACVEISIGVKHLISREAIATSSFSQSFLSALQPVNDQPANDQLAFPTPSQSSIQPSTSFFSLYGDRGGAHEDAVVQYHPRPELHTASNVTSTSQVSNAVLFAVQSASAAQVRAAGAAPPVVPDELIDPVLLALSQPPDLEPEPEPEFEPETS